MPNVDGKEAIYSLVAQECYECKKPLYKKEQVIGAFGSTQLLVCGDCDFDYRWRDALKAVGNPLSLSDRTIASLKKMTKELDNARDKADISDILRSQMVDAESKRREDAEAKSRQKKRKTEEELQELVKKATSEFKCPRGNNNQGHMALTTKRTECSSCKKDVCSDHLKNKDELAAGADPICHKCHTEKNPPQQREPVGTGSGVFSIGTLPELKKPGKTPKKKVKDDTFVSPEQAYKEAQAKKAAEKEAKDAEKAEKLAKKGTKKGGK
jgi:hypothetical protein